MSSSTLLPIAVLDSSVLVPRWSRIVHQSAAKAQYVVSHNLEDFPPLVQGRHVYRGVEYLTAIELIEDVIGEDAAATYGAPLPSGALIRSRRQA